MNLASIDLSRKSVGEPYSIVADSYNNRKQISKVGDADVIKPAKCSNCKDGFQYPGNSHRSEYFRS